MAAVFLAILPFALATTDFRRSNDVRKPPVEEPPPPPSGGPTVVAPARLPALGYLPDDCNVVFGVHAAELEATPAGKKLLHPKAGDAEGRVWLTEQGFAFVEEFAGIQPGQIDHLVVGLKSTTFPPAPMLVVRTRQKYDWAAIARAQGEVKPVEVHGRALYQFKFLEQGYGWLWLADETTLVLVLRATRPDERDKPVLAERPRQGDKLPPRAVRAVLEQRLRQGALLWWVAADLERSFWAGLLLPVGDPKSELANLVKQSKTLVGGLYLPGEARLEGGVEGPDAATATRLAALLQPKLGDPATARVVAPAAGSTEAWVSFQLSGPPETVLRVLQPGKLPLRLGH